MLLILFSCLVKKLLFEAVALGNKLIDLAVFFVSGLTHLDESSILI